MGDETWASIQLVKSKRESFREKLKRRKAERDTILSVASGSGGNSPASPATSAFTLPPHGTSSTTATSGSGKSGSIGVATAQDTPPSSAKRITSGVSSSNVEFNAEVERCLIEVLSDSVPPITAEQLLNNPRLKTPISQLPSTGTISMTGNATTSAATLLANLLQKFAYKELISVSDGGATVTSVQHNRLTAALEHNKQQQGRPLATPAPHSIGGGGACHTSRSSSTCTTNKSTTTSSAAAAATCSAADAANVPGASVKRPCGDEGAEGCSGEGAEGRRDGATHGGEGGACDKKPKLGSPGGGSSSDKDDVMSLLSAPSIRERENKRVGAEILELLNKPTAKEQSVAQHFRSQGGAKVREFCPRGTAEECIKWCATGGRGNRAWLNAGGRSNVPGVGGGSCGKLHFRKIIQHHTDEALGDCSFLNTCFHMDTCRYVHYEVDYSGMEELVDSSSSNLQQLDQPHQQLQQQQQQQQRGGGTSALSSDISNASSNNRDAGSSSSNTPVTSISNNSSNNISSINNNGGGGSGGLLKAAGGGLLSPRRTQDRTVLFPPQWIQCDLRFLDMAILGKFSVIMADPPWDIHMELPYGTMSDDEMRQLNIPALQDEGLIFLWVTGRAMELGRECLTLWGYERVDEIIWVKTNQLQRIIRTGRTGHWLNHGKEHCLVGMKGHPKINRCMDCDVIVAEVRATSHKPDEIYGIIERLSPGTRKIELFGRHHNVQPNWLTLGNQLEGVNLLEEDLIRKFKEHHPDGVHANKD